MMNLPISAKISSKGHLEIGGCDTVELAEEFGTPLYVLDEATVRDACQQYKKALQTHYPNSLPVYASKALAVKGLIKIIADEGLGVDVVSGGELFTALEAGMDPQKMYFHGNNKSQREVREALAKNVGRIVVDNFHELDLLEAEANKLKCEANILLRVTPEVEAHTHKYIQTGQLDSKFGFRKEDIPRALEKIKGFKKVNLLGLHSHIGSQIFALKPFGLTAEKTLVLAKKIAQMTRINVSEINLGGGLGVTYTAADKPPAIAAYIKKIADAIKKKCKQYKMLLPKLIVEPGRSIVSQAGVTLYSVGSIKDIPKVRKYVAVDGGMADNVRPITYGSKYDALVASRAKAKKTDKFTLAGRFCESGDILIKDIKLPKVEAGDVIAVLSTGAYCYALSSNYNRVPRPAMILVKNGKAKIILRRETYQDLSRNDL